MNIAIMGDNIEITEDIKNIVMKRLVDKLDKLTQHFSLDSLNANLRLSEHHSYGFRGSFNMWLPGKKQVFVEDTHRDLQSVIVLIRHEVERQIKDYNNKLNLNHSIHTF